MRHSGRKIFLVKKLQEFYFKIRIMIYLTVKLAIWFGKGRTIIHDSQKDFIVESET